MSEPKRLSGKTAIITGGGRGIGAACAKSFVEQGARVVIASRTEEELTLVADAIAKSHGREHILPFTADISQEKDVQALFAAAEKAFGTVDILINNAAIAPVQNFAEISAATWDEVMSINLRGSFLCAKEAFAQMKKSKKGGSIVNMSSLGGIRGTPKFKGLSAYVVSKHGIIGLTESLAVEGKEHKIRVNCVAPGAVDTEMLRKAAPFLKTNTTPEDVAKTILFLSDENQSASLTGAIIEIHSNA